MAEDKRKTASEVESASRDLLVGYLVENTDTGGYQFFKKLEHAHIRHAEWVAAGCGVSITNLYKPNAC